MFFVLYALALLVFVGGIALGIPFASLVLLYAGLALLVSTWVSVVRTRRRAYQPAQERRRSALPLQPTHW